MRNLRILAALGLIAAAGVAQAEVTGTAAIVSDYDFRGIPQTDRKPALQLSIDYANESGWYLGTWGSNVDSGFYTAPDGIGSASTEVDVYTGFRGTAGDLGWDAGINYYSYPGATDYNFAEIYGKLSYSIVSGGVYYTNDYGGTTDESAFYVYGDVAIPVAEAVSVTAHAGFSSGDGIDAAYGDTYKDYAIGLSYSASNLTLGVKYVITDGEDFAEDRVILSVSTALPWK
ncbi:MAG TPA: TorF family putative porin [Povalibacter sp.]|nr:TorF family putative porin [Povalibacter sp.]